VRARERGTAVAHPLADEVAMAACTLHYGTIEDWARIVRGEYEESPGLSLTRAQARLLWSLDATLCDAVLAHLTNAGYLRENHRSMFVRDDGSHH
jgi:hypothetical protein